MTKEIKEQDNIPWLLLEKQGEYGSNISKVLMVTYFFPPIVGVFRPLKFAKYLPNRWKPVILTVRNPDHSMRLDPHFTKDKLSDAKIFRSYSVSLGWISKIGRIGINPNWFSIPDFYIGWLPSSILLGKKIIKKEKIDIIYAACSPPTSLIIAAYLKKITGKPLVIDYMDLWTNNPFVHYPTKVHYILEKKLEGWVLKRADAVIVLSKDGKERLLKSFPFLNKNKVYVIPNGYDPDDFSDVKPYRHKKFTLLYAGKIYGPQVDHFKVFLKALHKILHQHKKIRDFQVILIGSLSPGVQRNFVRSIQELNLTTRVRYLGLKTHEEAIRFILGADVLLLIPGSRLTITTKIFEYLTAGNFILNIGDPTGQEAQIISEAKAGQTIKPNTLLLQEALYKILNLKSDKLRKNEEVLNRFFQPTLTKNLVSIFDLIMKNN